MKFKGTIRNGRPEIFNHDLIKNMLVGFEGKEVEIDIKPITKSRSNQQNRWYWGVAIQSCIIPQLQEQTGEVHTKEEIHQFHLTEILKCKFSSRTILGKTVIIFDDVSTKDMSTTEFNNFKDKVQHYWAERDIYIPDPNEDNYHNQIRNVRANT
jgi:hypothetical protein